ncbi:MAG: hypothetical protein JW730_08010 [Anaerolineales bacterium]|nr:hypothetical protein [Anaerolineales bacterium]
MTFHSILFERMEENPEKALEEPEFFINLNLDQVVKAITAGKQEYNLKPFFYVPLKDIDSIKYRQEIFRDLQNDILFENIKSFAQKMFIMREYLKQRDKLYYESQKKRLFLDAVEIYCEAVDRLAQDLSATNLRSRGFRALREYLTGYVGSAVFNLLWAETKKLLADLSSVKYSLIIYDNKIKVRKYESEADYSVEVEETFQKFKQGAVKDYRVKHDTGVSMNHIEAQILDFVAQQHPDIFSNLDNYCSKNTSYLDRTIAVFDREIQFYVAFLEYAEELKRTGLKFCYPEVSDQDKEVYDYEGFDLALAYKLIGQKLPVVCNDFYLKGKERIIVVSGPNQGGKTTFARIFGQLHYLASLGCPVPGKTAKLFLFDRILTHFEKEENIQDLQGKLLDDLVRINHILDQATSNSVIIMNEIFTSTTLDDASILSKRIMEKTIQLDVLCVWVTFIDELASFSEQTVSMVSTIVPENPALRTYKIVRKPADGLAYAVAIAEKYRLTYNSLKERVKV